MTLLCGVGLLCGAGLSGPPLSAAERYDPSLRFRTIVTPHFFIHFHQGEDALARRLSIIAEEVRQELVARLGPQASRERTHVVLVDQTDVANGWATPLPFNTLEITAAAPRPTDFIGNTDDWLRLVFTHEYGHILHLDRAAGWIGGLRRVFGRAPLLFPNLFLPQWQIEGIATWVESDVTGGGRIPAGDFRRVVDAAARAGRFEPLDRASGGLVQWPADHAAYAYGGYFHDFLSRTYGAAALRELTDETSGRVPYFGSRAFSKIFDRSLGELWRDFKREAESRAGVSPESGASRLTRHGFIVGAPRWSADGRSLFYSARDPHRFPALMTLDVSSGAAARLTTRVGGDRTAAGPGVVIFDQLEYVRSVGVQSDLYELRLPDRSVRRLTHGARVSEPDLAPDGRRIACIVQRPGRRALAIVDFDSGQPRRPRILAEEAETQLGAPRWSPDGRRIAVERRRLHGPSAIVVFDVEGGVLDTVAVSSARLTGPEWTRDGRWLLVASDRDGGPFNLYAVEIATRRTVRLTALVNGAHAPALSPDGRTIAFVGYTADGLDLFAIDLPPAIAETGTPSDVIEPPQTSVMPAPESTGAPYRPGRSLLPRFWMPVVQEDDDRVELGAVTGGIDALGRHAYGASMTWGIGGTARPDWQASYLYDRWRPTLFVAASDDGSEFQGARYRDQTADVGLTLPFRRMRRTQRLVGSFHADRETRVCPAGGACEDPGRSLIDRRAARFGWTFSTARRYGYSISAEDGVVIAAAIEAAREALGSTGDATTVTLQARAYPRLGPRHGVLALRAAGAASWGDRGVRRLFGMGGPIAEAPGGFGRDAIGLLRGYDAGAAAGRRAAVVNIDYRWPLLYVERGEGTWPVFFRSLHAAAFVDAGHAWSRAFDAARVKVTAGLELSMDLTVSYYAPLTLAAGVAWRRDGARQLADGSAVFARVGRAF